MNSPGMTSSVETTNQSDNHFGWAIQSNNVKPIRIDLGTFGETFDP